MHFITPFFELEKQPDQRTAVLYLNRPAMKNAMNDDFWFGLAEVVSALEADAEVRTVVVAGRGNNFSSGIDLTAFFTNHREEVQGPDGDTRARLHKTILAMQQGLRRLAASPIIFIAAIEGYCIGGGLDLAAACDLRLATAQARFSLREAKLGIVADMGSLSRLPGIIGQGHTRLLALTGRDIDAAEALRIGLLAQTYADSAALQSAALALAAEIAANPNLAVTGTKRILNYMESHSSDEGMDYVALWNAAFLDSRDLRELVVAFMEKRQPKFQ